MKGERAVTPVQDVGVGYLLDLQVERVEEAATCSCSLHVKTVPLLPLTEVVLCHR